MTRKDGGKGASRKSKSGPKKCPKILNAIGTDKVPLGHKGFLVFFDKKEGKAAIAGNLIYLLEECAQEVKVAEEAASEMLQENDKPVVKNEAEEAVEDKGSEGSCSEGDEEEEDNEDEDDDDANSSVVSDSSSVVANSRAVQKNEQSPKPFTVNVTSHNSAVKTTPNVAKSPPKSFQRRPPRTGKSNGTSGQGLQNLVQGGAEALTRRTKQSIKRKNYYELQGPTMHMPKPQLKFKDKPVNDDSPFKPKLSNKPNAIKPLDLKPKVDPKTNKLYHDHPYKFEIENWIPSPPFMTYSPNRAEPIGLDRTPYLWVATRSNMNEMINELRQASEISFDVEHSDRGYYGLTCLIQLSTRHKDYVIDCFAPDVRESMFRLNEIFTNPNILKVAHSAQCDVVYLQRDFGVYVVGLFDTCAAEKVIMSETRSAGLASLLQKYVNVEADKKYQLADWRVRPLIKEMMEYARMDTHYLLHIYDLQKKALLDMQDRNFLFQAYQNSKSTCLIRFEKPDWREWLTRKARDFNNQQWHAVCKLNEWRNKIARDEDDSVGMIASNKTLMNISKALPSSKTEMIHALHGRNGNYTQYMKRDEEILLKIFNDSLAIPLVKGVDPITRVVCREITLNDPDVVFYSSEFPHVRKVVFQVLSRCNGKFPDGITRILPVSKTLSDEPGADTLQTILEGELSAATGAYTIITNHAGSIRESIQNIVSTLEPTLLHQEVGNKGAHILLYTSPPRSFISIINDVSNFPVLHF